MPDERARRPLRAHERILAAHEVDVARPEELVVAILREEGRHEALDRSARGLERAPVRERRRRDALGCDQPHRARVMHARARQAFDGGAGVREEAHLERALGGRPAHERAPEGRLRARVVLEFIAPAQQALLAQEPAGARREAGKEVMLRERQARVRRRQRVAALDPLLGAEVFEVDPARLRLRRRHREHVRLGRIAAEGLDDDIGDALDVEGVADALDLDLLELLHVVGGIDLGAQLREHGEVVEPEAHALAVLARDLAREPPRHADVAEVVDDTAEDVPALGAARIHGGDSSLLRPALFSLSPGVLHRRWGMLDGRGPG